MKLTLLEVTTSGEQYPEPPWAYRKIHVKYRIGGQGLTDKAVAQAISLSQEKYCSVAATVRGSGFKVQGSGFRGSGFRGSGFRGSRFRVQRRRWLRSGQSNQMRN
jgi:hypothetical protein